MPTRELGPPQDTTGEDLEATVLTIPATEAANSQWEQHYKISVPALVGQEDLGMDTGSPAEQPDVLEPLEHKEELHEERSIKFSDILNVDLGPVQQLGLPDDEQGGERICGRQSRGLH